MTDVRLMESLYEIITHLQLKIEQKVSVANHWRIAHNQYFQPRPMLPMTMAQLIQGKLHNYPSVYCLSLIDIFAIFISAKITQLNKFETIADEHTVFCFRKASTSC